MTFRGPPRLAPAAWHTSPADPAQFDDPLLPHLGRELRKIYAPLLADELPAALAELVSRLDGPKRQEQPFAVVPIAANTA